MSRPPFHRRRRPLAVLALVAGVALGGLPGSAGAAVVGPAVTATVATEGTVVRGGLATFRVTVRNVGTAATNGPVRLRVDNDYGESPPTTFSGDGWSCVPEPGFESSCTLDRPLAAGETAPLLTVHRRSIRNAFGWDTGDQFVELEVGPFGAPTRAEVPVVADSLVDLDLTGESLPADRFGPREYELRVRNGDGAPTEGPTVVMLDAGGNDGLVASGDGWTCDAGSSRCEYRAVLRPLQRAPVLRVATTRSTEAKSYDRDDLVAQLTGGGDDDKDPDERLQLATERRRSLVDLVPVATDTGTVRDGARHVGIRVHAVGPADSTGPVHVAFSTGYGSTTDPRVRASGAGWSCFPGAGECTYPGPIPSGSAAPPLDVAVPLDATSDALRFGARVSGGGDTDPDYEYAPDNDGTGVVINRGAAAAGTALRLAVPKAGPLARGATSTFEVTASNPEGAPRRTRPVVQVSTAFAAQASGDGWVCTSKLACRLDGDLAPGATAEPIRVRVEVPFAAPVEGTLVRASSGDTDTAVSGATADDVASPTFDVRGPDALVPGEDATVLTHVENPGVRPIPGPFTVTMSAPYDGVRFFGDGWVCVDSGEEYLAQHCTHDGPIPAGGALPPIETTIQAPISGSSRVTVRSTLHYGPRRDVQPTSAGWSAPILGRPVDLTVTAEEPHAQLGDERATATLVVRNRGVRSSSAGVRVAASYGGFLDASGEGWTCGRYCEHDGEVPAGGSLPPLRVALPSAAPRSSTTGTAVRVSNASDVDHTNDATTLIVPASTPQQGRYLDVLLDPTTTPPPHRGDSVSFVGSVAADGAMTGGVRLEADAPPGLVVEALEADGLVCTSPTSCRWETAPRPDERRPFAVRARLTDDAVGPLELVVRASSDAADVSAGTGTARVVPEDSGADLTVALGDSTPVPFSGAFRVPVVVRNGGSADSPGPVDVEFFHPTGSMGDVTTTGPGWQCSDDGRSCRWPAGVAAGAALPELTIRPNLHPDDYRFGSGPIVARVSDAADTQRGNDQAQARVPATGVPGPDLAAAISPVDAIRNGDGTPFDVRIRNTGGQTTTEPVQVDVGADPDFAYYEDGVAVVAAGEGWRCSGRRSRCTLDHPLAAGEEAAPLRTVVRVPAFPEAGEVYDGLAEASVSIVRGDQGANSSNNYATAAGPARPATDADVVATVDDTEPVPDGGPAVFRVRVANVGRSTTNEPVEVRARSGDSRSAALGGEGWICGSDVCRLPGSLSPGEHAPDLELEVRDDFGERVGAVGGSVAVTGDVGGFTSNNTAGASVGAHVSDGGAQDLLPTIDDIAPGRLGTSATATVRVRNLGRTARGGPVVVMTRANTDRDDGGTPRGEDGWTCTLTRCEHPGPVPPGGTLPPIVMTAPAAPVGSTAGSSFRAWVVPDPPDSSRPENARQAAVSVPVGRIPADLGVSVRGGAAVRPGESTTVEARVHNAGSEPYVRSIVTYLSSTAGRLAVSGAGDGWTCAGLRCERPGPLGPGEETPPILVTATAPVRDGAGSASVGVSLRSPGDYPRPPVEGDWLAFDDEAYVGIGVGAGMTDLVPWVRPEVLPVVGGTASTLVHVRNVGSASAQAQTTVTVASSLPGAGASGDGWTCDGLRCSRAGAPGATTLPPIRVVAPVPGDASRGSMTLGVRVQSDDDDATANDATTWSTGIAGGPADEVRASPYFAVATQHPRLAPGERAAIQLRVRGIAPADGASATVSTLLPEGLTYAGAPSGEDAPDVDGRVLTWRLTMPDEGKNRTLTFFAAVAADARPGSSLRLDSTLSSPALASVQRRSDGATIVTPSLSGVAPASFDRGAPASVELRGTALRAADRIQLVADGGVIEALGASGDDERLVVTFDPRGQAIGKYDVVVRRAAGGTLVLPGAVTIVEAPPTEEPPAPTDPPTTTPSAPTNPTTTPAGPTPDAPPAAPGSSPPAAAPPSGCGSAAAALAALIAALGASPPGTAATPGGRPVSRVPLTLRYLATARPPRIPVLVRSGWVVAVRTTGAATLRAELRADAVTARRLGVPRGAVLARAVTGVRSAGDIRLRLRVPASLRRTVRRAGVARGSLVTRAVAGSDAVSRSTPVVLRR